MANTKLMYYLKDGEWLSPGRIPLQPSLQYATQWQLRAGESLTDNMPSGVPVVNITDYSTSNDLYVALEAVEDAETRAVYVNLGPRTFYINTFKVYGTNDWRGWANTRRRVMGLIGAGVDSTVIQVQPGAVNAAAGARDFILDPPSLSTDLPVCALYFSNMGTDTPLFITGIDFRGTLQTPFSVYSANAQTKFRRNHAVPSPLAWSGAVVWRAVPGSRVQFCRFQGFGFALNTAPPYEKGALSTNYCDGLIVDRTEVDGRISGDLDPARPLSSGGVMWNKSLDTTLRDVYLHHTRRSGWATNTNTGLTTEKYTGIRVRTSDIADPSDSWAGDNGRFNGSNVEEVVGVFDYQDCVFSVHASQAHVNYALPATRSNSSSPSVVPSHPVIKVRGFSTPDTDQYGGCLRIAVSRQPNSTGISPAWQKLNDMGIAASGLFDIRDSAGTQLTGVRTTSWQPSMTPQTHFVVSY